MKRVVALLVSLVVLPTAAAHLPTPVEQLLAHVPDRCALVIVVPSVEKMVAGIAAFGESLDTDDLADLDARTLLEALDLLEDVEGLDVGGPLLLAHGPDYTAPLILCTVQDLQAWRNVAHAEDAEGGILRVRVFGESGFAAVKDKVLILGDGRTIVQAALRADGKLAKRFHAHAGKLLPAHHVVVYAEVPAWQPLIDATLSMAAAYMRMGMAVQHPQNENIGEIWAMLISDVGRVLREAEVWTAGARVGSDGIYLQSTATFSAGGPVATYLSKVRKDNRPLLRGLPNEECMLVLGAEWACPPGTKSLAARWSEAVLDTETMKKKLGEEAFTRAMKATMASCDLTRGYNAMFARLPDTKGLLTAGRYFTSDPQAVIQYTCAASEISPEFMNALGDGSTMDLDYRRERIGPTEVHVFDISFEPADEQTGRMLEMLYGTETGQFLAAHAGDVLYTGGPTAAARAQMGRLLAEQGGKLLDNPRVAAANSALSPNPQALILVDLPKTFEFVTDLVRATGVKIPPLKISQKPTALVGFAVYLEPGRTRAELRVPAEPVRALVDAIRSAGECDSDY